MAKNYLPLFLLGAMICALTGPVDAMDHIVGRSFGWNMPHNISYYDEWAQGRTFSVGDKLVFLFRSGMQNVIEVGQKDFDGCTQKKMIKMYEDGPTIVEIKKPGEHYFICGIEGRCTAGQKLKINVTGDATLSTSSATSIRNFGAVAGLISLLASFFI